MYNRYVRNDHGVYTRIPTPDQPRERVEGEAPNPRGSGAEQDFSRETAFGRQTAQAEPDQTGSQNRSAASFDAPDSKDASYGANGGEGPRTSAPYPPPEGRGGFVSRILELLHLQDVDTADLLLLLLLFFLFEEKADDELLIALGLLLIL